MTTLEYIYPPKKNKKHSFNDINQYIGVYLPTKKNNNILTILITILDYIYPPK